ncbi:MAG TPA: ATP-dependent zinc metalloprotease FtsH [bacterium]|nr:ATP-dependent zinc metalloprotease FtsH [bacterium]HNZ73416.1 ATP-dependent zinc metalloprotease FtsH [bacterium]HOH67305.1 ATP-dependent zinc metalloprotease FtsH [bacterium]HPN81369.1 ATP-dependent zinc metalloprotease FtsH [bacterium]HPW39323.1 ATP-dependent zinc metalloprotease FtsH [bacterium]
MKNLTKNFLIAFVVFLAFASLLSLYNLPNGQPQEIDLATLINQIETDQVKTITVQDDKLNITLNNDEEQIAYKEPNESLSALFDHYGVNPDKTKQISITIKKESELIFWLATILPFLIPLLFVVGFFLFMMRQAQGANSKAMSFGQSGVKEFNPNKKIKTTFNDVAGVKEAKKELEEVVEFLKNPKKFTSLGATIPKGVLLLGAPGTGKTLLAKAVAGEANVPFFSISGSEFVEMFVGVGASRVRDLFRRAKKNAPCIVFIDEIDAVGRQRGAGLGGSHDEREQTLNQILVEMDGFEPNTNVIVMAATNRPDVLDSALLRPGRFDRRVTLDLPDINDREMILKVHRRKKPMAADVNLRQIGERTPGFSGADLSNLLNEAAILAALNNKKQINQLDIINSIDKILLGPERKSHILNKAEKEITAYHEAGHALVAHLLPNTDPVRKVSIIARGMAAGFTLKLPSEDKKLHSRSEFIEELAVLLAGRITEKKVFDEVTTGAQSDLREATKLAKRLITEYGMSDKLGLRTFGEREELVFLGRELHEQRDYSEKTAQDIDEEIYRLTSDAAKTAEKIITEHKIDLDKIAQELLIKETIEAEEFEKLLGKKKTTTD